MKIQVIAEGASYYKNGKFEVLGLGIHEVPDKEAQDLLNKKYAVPPPSVGIPLKENESLEEGAEDKSAQPRTPMPNKK